MGGGARETIVTIAVTVWWMEKASLSDGRPVVENEKAAKSFEREEKKRLYGGWRVMF